MKKDETFLTNLIGKYEKEEAELDIGGSGDFLYDVQKKISFSRINLGKST
ncbi:MAG: hypothetical protein PWQ77_424 [Kosmotogales bacterium]|nr:hypothetical protein [Kosmotogales bacterium]